MDQALFDKIQDDIHARKEWASRQSHWYTLRTRGIGRKYKPYPHCHDKRFPLIDMGITKKKPVYVNQLFASERLADFFPADPRDQDEVVGVSWWFDYKLKHRSNLEEELDLTVDFMCLYGRGVLKVMWNPDSKEIEFDAIEPIFVVVPDGTKNIQRAPYLVHIMHLSVWDYKNGLLADEYNQDEMFIKRIQGGDKESDLSDEGELIDVKKRQEGINYSSKEDCIIVWEIYERDKKGRITVHTISPLCWDEPIREPFEFNIRDNKLSPFIDFKMEATGKSFYSSRGMAETGADFQSHISSTWNGKCDAMQMWNNPPLSAQKDVGVTQNIRTGIPGSIIPFPVAAVTVGPPPISWDMEMSNTRDITEQVWAIPDFALGEKAFGDEKKKGSNQTATEVQFKQGWTNQVVDYQSRTYRRSLARLWNFAWDVYYEHDDDMRYFHSGEYKSLSKDVRDKVESLRPAGSSQSWDISRRYQKAVQRFMMFNQDPMINQGNLRKGVLELDEPGLVEELLIDPNIEKQNQVSNALKEIPALEMGLPLAINPTDDHAIHFSVESDFMTQKMQKQMAQPTNELGLEPPQQNGQGDPKAIQAHVQHMQAHMQELMKQNPKAARQLQQQAQQKGQQAEQQQKQQMAMAQEPRLQL